MTKRIIHLAVSWRYHLLFFILSWGILSIYYGDVLYIAQQNSFFTTESPLMQFVTGHKPYGYLWWLGRAFLQLFYYPLLGGAVTALLLTICSGLIHYVFRLKKNLFILQFVPASAWLFYCFFQGFNLYYQAETGKILGIPICIFIILLLQSLFIRTFSKKKISTSFRSQQESKKRIIIQVLAIVILLFTPVIWNEYYRPYVRITTQMEKAMQKEDWQKIKDIAKNCNVSARPIAAYYAIALMQTNEITQSLFDIEYNYADIYLYDRNGDKDYGTGYYEMDGNFYAGLINSSYRNAMERLTMDGPSALILKRLAETSLLNNERELCRKYIRILKCLPFEEKFIIKIENMYKNTELIKQDRQYSQIMKLEPTENSFETFYPRPLFLGYNINLMQGSSLEALQASLAACLYSKMMPAFLIRTEPLINIPLAQNVQDALVLANNTNKNISQIFQLDELSKEKFDLFTRMAATYKKNRAEGAKQLKAQFLGYYPYYYYFGNLNTEKKSQKSEKTNNQIN